MRKFPVASSVMANVSYSRRCLDQNAAAWRVTGVKLTFNKGWFPDKQFAVGLYQPCGREYLDMLTDNRMTTALASQRQQEWETSPLREIAGW